MLIATILFIGMVVCCPDGTFEYNKGCMPCDSSCKTCSSNTTCDTCEPFMRFDSATSLCTHCADGEYYDDTYLICRSCPSTCTGKCNYRETCLSCVAGESLDLDTLTCISDCAASQIKLEGNNLSIDSACRTLAYYIDQHSDELLELGTKDYPYRTMKSVSSEILNFMSHKEVDITIYLKDDVYMEDNTLLIVNMTGVNITTHPDVLSLSKRSRLIPSKFPQPGVSQKARFHLLKTADLPYQDALDAGNFTATELSQASTPTSIMVIRSGIAFSSIDLYREEVDYNENILFARGLYLQNKTCSFSDMLINITGVFWESYDPYNVYIRNLEIDTYSLWNMFYVRMLCNYPEAYKTPTVDIDGFHLFTSTDRTIPRNPLGFGANIPGNWTIKNLIAEDFYCQTTALAATFYYTFQDVCIPEDDLPQYGHFENFRIAVDNKYGDRFNLVASDMTNPHYRKTYQKYINMHTHNFHQTTFIPMFFNGSPLDEFEMIGYNFYNSSLLTDLFVVSGFSKAVMGTIDSDQGLFQNITSFSGNLMTFASVGSIDIKNIKISNYTGGLAESMSFISLLNSADTPTAIEGIEVEQSNFFNGGIITIQTDLDKVEIKDISISSSTMRSGIALFQINTIRCMLVSNILVSNLHASLSEDELSTIFRVTAFDLQGDLNSTVDTFLASGLGVSLLKFGSLVNENSNSKELEFKDFTVKDSVVSSSRSIISTENLETTSNFHLILTNLQTSNITFSSTGDLLLFNHALLLPITIQDSTFTSLRSAAISIVSSRSTAGLTNSVVFDNCSFTEIYSPALSLIKVSEESIASFTRSNFFRVSVGFDVSGIIEVTENAVVRFRETNFTENSAVVATLLTVQSGAYVELDTCVVANNFAVTNGVFAVTSNGYLTIRSSTIFENSAIRAPIGQIFDAAKESVIDNCRIYNNSVISPSEFVAETSGGCSKLCYLDTSLVANIIENKLHEIDEGFYIIEILSGSLQIINNSLITDQNGVLNLFMSSLVVDSSTLNRIIFSRSPMRITSSTLELKNALLTGITGNFEKEIFLVNDESTLIVQNLTYEQSSMKLFTVLTGEVNIEKLTANNISNFHTLIHIYSAHTVMLNSLIFQNLETTTDYVVKIESSNNTSFDTVSLKDFNKTVIYLSKSNAEMIQNINISNCFKAMEFIESTIKHMRGSVLSKSGDLNNLITGGAIKIMNSNVKITDTSFINNTAGVGGAIEFGCQSVDLCSLKLENVTFSHNAASVQGGAISYNMNRPEILSSVFENNSAQYGPDLASYPIKVRIKDQPNTKVKFSDIGSGISISTPIVLALLDYDGQIVNLNNEDQVSVLSPSGSNSSILGVSSVTLEAGIATIDGIIFVDEPGIQNSTFLLSTDAIDRVKVSTVFPSENFSNEITVNFRYCQPGEEITSSRTCRQCDAGTYSLLWNSTSCDKCMNNADCLGQNQISVNPGYWRATQESTFIAECIFKAACDGGFSNNTTHPVHCAAGYQGELCGQCYVDQNVKYRKVSNVQCSKCPSPILNAILIVGVGVLVFVFVMMLIVININKTRESQLSVLLRIMTNYLQLIFASLSLSSSYPTSMVTFFEITGRFGDASGTFLSIDCFVRDYDITGPFESNAVFKLFLLMLLPIILFAVVATIWIGLYCLKRKYVKSLQRNLVISFISIVFLLHPKLTEQSLTLFRCVKIDEGDSRVRLDTHFECYSSNHLLWISTISVPIIVIWVISCPLAALILLYKYLKAPYDNKVKQYFMILYQGLNRDKFYWEFVNTARKILILIIFPFSTSMKMLIAVSGLVIFARIQIRLQPYTDTENNKIEISAINAGILTIFSGLLYSQDEGIGLLDTATMIFCLVLNAHFFVNWLYLLVKSMQDSSKFSQFLFKFLTYLLCREKDQKKPTKNNKNTSKPKPHKTKFKKHKRRIGLKRSKKAKTRPKPETSQKYPPSHPNNDDEVLFSSKNIQQYLQHTQKQKSSSRLKILDNYPPKSPCEDPAGRKKPLEEEENTPFYNEIMGISEKSERKEYSIQNYSEREDAFGREFSARIGLSESRDYSERKDMPSVRTNRSLFRIRKGIKYTD
ncbi:unnamed protein product [Moneuplotes crassus]|uniref:Uncharacterized protein n=1 Tax=Euplotes crassus TaxID=5936 RepID=A0AAD1XGQ1_EUPCR|nr:unnamed protein product [Moneuplotes crassus]